jgi:hypothetical protein
MPQISNPKNETRSISHTGQEIGDDNVERTQNTPDLNSPILKWTCPRKYQVMKYAGGRHKTKFVPRYRQELANAAGGEEDVALNDIMQPIVGQTDRDEQPYPPVVAYNDTQGMEITNDLVVNYTDDSVTLPSGTSQNDTIYFWPILVSGTIQYRGIDQFGHEVAPLDEWSTKLSVFHDFDQQQNNTQIHLIGAMQWSESETLAVFVNAPEEIVWEDADYPRDQYATRLTQYVSVSV